jgi:shikimate dehydrogenase
LARPYLAVGAPVASGHDMLLHQAARQFELMTGRDAPLAAMRAALPAHT